MLIPRLLQPFARQVELPRSRVRLFYYEAGDADSPAMILVHGLGDEADTWRRVIGSLSGSFRVIAPDLPGFGRSSLPVRRPLSPPFLAGVMRELVDQLGIRHATWVGSSLGASIAQIVAIRWPARVARLVLVDGGVQARPRLRAALLGMLVPGAGERRYANLSHDLDAAYETLRPYYGNLDGLPPAERAFLRERVKDRVTSDTQRVAYFSAFRSLLFWMLLAGRRAARRARSLDGKTLYVWGSDDRIVPSGSWNAKNARVTILAGAGHLPHQELPEEFVQAIEEFDPGAISYDT
jgi:pimeloyl-ACP methyl ester carboxylesterase